MDLIQALTSRRSIRSFDTTKHITDNQIHSLLEIARWAPSAGNLQSYQFIVVKNSKQKMLLAKTLMGRDKVSTASAVFICCADTKLSSEEYGPRGKSLYAIQDATLAAYALWLAVHNINLGGVWIGSFYEKKVQKLLSIPPYLKPVVILPIGYPAEKPKITSRKTIEEIVRFD
ncbi:nitroreductase family protein [Patescibacteria group bacterium]